jgi:sulfate/thiosulfate transport system ATP-binding protein
MNRGRIEQVGNPTQLYDEPATEFVMQFVGEANRLGDRWVRPHDLDLSPEPAPGGVEAQIERITRYGFDARIELVTADDEAILAQVTRDRLEELELERGQIVWVVALHERSFAERAAAAT